MSKAGSSILKGAREALAYTRNEHNEGDFAVHVPEKVDVKAIRLRLKMTQAKFAALFGLNLGSLRNWEREGRLPDTATRAYLVVIKRDPTAVIKALGSQSIARRVDTRS